MNLRVKRPLALLLTVVMLLGLLPTAAFAAEPRSSAELTTLTLTPASGESINLMTNNTPIQWSVLETWTLNLGANLVTGQESTLTVTLAPGMQFVNLDVEALKDRLGVQDAVWTPGTPDWAENYDDYEVKSGTLTVTFESGASELDDFQLSLKPDTDLFPPELSGEAGELTIENAISVKLDDDTLYSADIKAVYNGTQPYYPSFGDMRQTVFNIPAGSASTIESLHGYFYAGWIYQSGQSAKRLLQKFSAEIAVPEGLALSSADDAWTVSQTREIDGDGNSIWTVTANNIYGASIVCYLDCTIPEKKATDGAVYKIKVTHITTVTEGQESSFESSTIRDAWTIYVKDPNEVYIKTEGLRASNVYNFTKNGNEDGNFSDYNSVFAAVRLTNDGVAAIEKELIYEAQFGQNAQFVTAVGIPCGWDNENNDGLPTSITITWDDNSATTITGADNIRAVASQFCCPGRGFMLLAKDLAGLDNYDADKSIKAVRVELPGLPKDYVSAGTAPIMEGVTGNNAYSAAWGRVRTDVADGTTDTNKYRLYEKGAEETDKNKQWTEVVTTVKDSGQIVNMDTGSYKATIQIDGKSATTAAGGDVVHVKQTITPHSYHNGSTRPAETIIVDPVVYILQPEGLTLYANRAEFTLSTGEDIKYEVREVTGEVQDVPDGWEIYEYTFTDSDGEPIVLGWYDGDWCSEDDGVRMTAKFAYGVPADATTATYDIRDYVFYKSSLNMPFARNTSGDPYHLNGGNNIGVVASSTFTVQPQPQFIITAQMQREGDGDKWYTYDPNNSKATTALLGDDDVVNVKITATNRTGKEVDGVTVYVPVPKTDSADILGDYFIEDCGFDMVITSPPNLPEGWTAYYGDVTEVITEADNEASIPSGEFQFTDSGNWSSGSYDNNTNLIRLDLNGTLADGETATLTLELKPAGDTIQAGETNLFKTWYQFNAAGVVMTDTSMTSIFGAELQNGVVSGVVFADTNRNGVKDANEPGISGVEVSAVDTTGRNYGPETTDESGKYSFTSVPSDAVLTVTVKNPKDPDPNHENGSYRFSTIGMGTGVLSNVTAARDNKSASKSGVSLSGGVATVNAGLITPYEVSFVVTGGTADPASVKIYGGQTLGEVLPDSGVTVTTGEGANFQGKWTKHPVNAGESSEVSHENLLEQTVSADTFYTAQIEAESYIIEAQYRTSSTDATMQTYRETVEHNNKPSDSFPSDDVVKATAPEGYVFTGWQLSTGGELLQRETIVGKEVTASAIYIAQYAPKSGITVTLDANGGKFGESEEPLTLSLTYGDMITSAEGYVPPTYEGHTFLGWAAMAESQEVIPGLTCPAGNATYYAVWKENTYTITFQGYGQSGETKTIQVKVGDAIGKDNIPEITKTGVEFKGWSDGKSTYSTEALADVVPEKDTTYTAQFSNVYLVTFFAGERGTINGDGSTTYSVASGETLSDIPTVDASEGWYFVWWADANGTTMYTSDALKSLTITGPTSFYARYGQISGNTSITLHTPTADDPNDTTLTASLENGTPDSYQWQKFNGTTWVNVDNVTGESLSLTGLQITDNGAKYQCVVTSGGNSATLGPVTLSVEKGDQEKPNVSATQPSTINGTGSIGTGDRKLTTAMEYNTDNGSDWTKVNETTAENGITGILSGTTYYIRYTETDYLNASPVQIITIGSFDPTKEPTPNGSFEASTMTLSGVESGQKYSINGGETWTEIIGDSVDLSDAGLKDGDTIQIYKPGNGTTTTTSDTQTIPLTQAAKPTGTAKNETSYQGKNGSITITNYNSNYTYQISSDNGSNWTDATVGNGGVISNLAPGDYVIRVKGSRTMLASEPSDMLTVDPYVQSSEAQITSFKVTVNGTEYPGNIDQEAGTITVTLPAGTDPQVLNSLTPAITHTGESINPDNTAQDFSNGGVTYTVTAGNGTTKAYTATITIAAPETYTINVDTQGNGTITTNPSGSAAADTEIELTVTPDEGYELKENSLKVTYTLDGGEQTVTVTDNKFTMPAADVTVSAEFEAVTYTIIYDLDGGINAVDNPTTYTVEDDITLSAPTKDGYTFTGWTWGNQTTPQQSVTLDAGSVTGDLTFTAHWEDEDTPIPPAEYSVIVNGSHADNSGAGDYAEGTTVTIHAGEYEGYTFAGWNVTSGDVELADAGSVTTTFTMPAEDVTVTATWTEVEEPEPTPADAITVTPADIIIYMGGKDGYEGTVNDNGDIVGSKSLPEPGFVFDLPDDLESALAAAGEDITDVTFQSADDESKTWKVELYQGLDESAARKLYTIVPTYTDPDPIRVVFTDGDKHIVSDHFTVGQEINKDFGMSLHTGPAGKIKAVYGGQEYPVELGEGILTVLGTTEKVTITTVTDTAPTNGQPGAVATASTTYTINDSEVEVTGGDVSLLFDNIINHTGNDRTSQLEARASEWLADEGITPAKQHQFVYELKYLDLVDANNGNAWVTASDDLTIYWPLPTGVEASKVKVLHFKDLHRDMTTGEIESEIATCAVENLAFQVEGSYITFKVGRGGFSPFALVWEEAIPENTFIINATAGSGGSISPSGAVQVTAGGSQTFAIISSSGYHIEDVLVDGVSVGAVSGWTFSNVQGNHTIQAVFDSNGGGGDTTIRYIIEAEAGRGGEISPDGRVRVDRGDDQTFRITADEGYEIADVIVDGESVGAVSRYIFENVRSDHTIEVIFEKYSSVADPDDTGVSEWLDTSDHCDFLHGYTDGTFGPNRNMTRGEVAQMFYNLLLEQDVPQTTVFTDVPADMWCADAVNTLASLGIVEGIGNGLYAPDRAITRAEFTVIAMRFSHLEDGGENIFSDVNPNDWFYEQVVGSIKYGWIQGYADGTFRPDNTITRAEVTTITNRMLGRAADEAFVDRHSDELRQFPDVPESYWAYYNIMEATNAHDFGMENGAENWTGLN